MKLSHSKLSVLLSCPMSYYLSYKQGIIPKFEKPALTIGSAIHWGIEHNTDDLREFYKNYESNITDGQLLAETIVKSYIDNKDEIFNEILTDQETGEKLELLNEIHEVYLTSKIKNIYQGEDIDFVGIIDLLLITNKGLIIIDFKTSSKQPIWEDYLDQIYRYIFLVRQLSDMPILKIGIINLRKCNLKRKLHESDISYKSRLNIEYSIKDEQYINFHSFEASRLDENVINDYIINLCKMCNTAYLIDSNNAWFINYNEIEGKYGRSQFYDIFMKTKGCHFLYNIKDKIYNKETGEFLTKRECKEIDMMVIDHQNVLNKYEQFELQALSYFSVYQDINKEEFFNNLKKSFITDDDLLEQYWITLENDIKK